MGHVNTWYYARGGQQSGPVSEDDLRRMLATGELSADSMIWADGMAAWAQVRTVPQLASASADPSAAGYAPDAGYGADPASAAAGGYAQPAGTSYATGPLRYESHGGQDLRVSPLVIMLLRQTKPWARLMSVLMFIGAGFLILGGLIQLLGLMMLGGATRGAGVVAVIGMVGPLVNFALGILYLAPAIFLGRYATRIGNLVRMNRQADLEGALESQKSFWKFTGIVTLVMIGLIVLLLAVVIVGFGMLAGR
jgi:hypothetical protein